MHQTSQIVLLITTLLAWLPWSLFATACEDEHPPVTRTPVVRYQLHDSQARPVAAIAFDPRGTHRVHAADETDVTWVRDPDRSGAWDYREWQWWKGHPWGESCRCRYWCEPTFKPEKNAVTIHYQVDGFESTQQYLLPQVVEAVAPHWDLVTTIKNISGSDVEEYGQFFACYTQFNQPNSFWFWEQGKGNAGKGSVGKRLADNGDAGKGLLNSRLTLFSARGVDHLNGYVAHPAAYFLEGGAVPHCPRGEGKIVSRWYRPMLVSQPSPQGWRSIILVEPERTAAVSQGLKGAAMDYILFPGPARRTFAAGAEFSAHIRHHLLKSSELPSKERLDTLWKAFERSHSAVHRAAAELR